MTEQQNPITPPNELLKQWKSDYYPCPGELLGDFERYIATQSSQWGYDQCGEVNEAKLQQARDQELAACNGWLVLYGYGDVADRLRAARRPKPPSLKEQALEELELLRGDAYNHGLGFDAPAIRRAIESLPD